MGAEPSYLSNASFFSQHVNFITVGDSSIIKKRWFICHMNEDAWLSKKYIYEQLNKDTFSCA